MYEVENGRARITLNRPEKLNALSRELLNELNEALWEADNDNRVHAVILRGAGRAFSAGYDLTPTAQATTESSGHERSGRSFEDDSWRLEQSQRLRMVLFDMHKPVIAQVHGYCLAGGTDIALLCDLIIADEDARIGFPPARAQGALPNNMWLYNVGPQWAKRLMLTGDMVTGKDAAKIGLVLKAVPGDLLESEVETLVNRMAMIDSELLAANKRIINMGLELMGARTLQRFAAENDARAHLAPSVSKFNSISQEQGLKAALNWRDGKFGDPLALVSEPEIRDESGNFTSSD
jgi:enoyl-CoA hydratase